MLIMNWVPDYWKKFMNKPLLLNFKIRTYKFKMPEFKVIFGGIGDLDGL